MTIPSEWAAPYWSSVALSILLAVGALKWPKGIRVTFGSMFIAASIVNARLAIAHPAEYLDYADFALLDVYRRFILGFFAEHTQMIVLAIAAAQVVIGAMLLRERTAKLGALGAATFLVAIAPLGVGSAFPFALFAVVALYLAVRDASPQPSAT